ncbi:MAG: TonB-dependent receptor [Gemmatimonadales bacterium]
MLQYIFLAALFGGNPVGPFAVSGRVIDSAGAPIVAAQIVLLEAHRSTRTDQNGRYRIDRVPEGTYGISVAAIGFRPRIGRIVVRSADLQFDVTLARTVIELPPIQTTATPLATSALESPQPLSVLSGEALASHQAPSLGAVLEGLPGLRNNSTGSGIGKPVIRGLGGNRVLILDDGQRMETQQWGDEHAPNVETATADRIEVIRGPASVLYGSDALGGVINVVQRDLPDAGVGRRLLRGELSTSWASNGHAPDGSALLEGAAGRFGFRGTLSGRSQQNIRTPAGDLSNSGLSMLGGSLSAGVHGGRGNVTATYTQRNERLEIHEDPAEAPDATGYQRIGARRGKLAGDVALGGGTRLEFDLGLEQNRRREFEDADATVVALGLLSRTTTANAHLHIASSAHAAGVVGVSFLRTTFSKFGEETLIPNSTTTGVGAFGFEQLEIGRWQFSFGARFDQRTLDNESDAELGLDAGTRHYHSLAGNVGALYRLADGVALVVNAGRGFRAPSPFELFSNGVHEGTVRFERGNPVLKNETSFNVDAAIRVQQRAIRAELGIFRNAVNNYIYPRPSGIIDPESGFQIFDVSQGDALLTGVEASMEYHPRAWLHLRAAADFTHGENSSLRIPLAFVAPLRVNGSIRFEGKDWRGVGAPYFEVGAESNARQSRLDPEDTAPAGYTITNIGAGVALTGGQLPLRLDLQVRNLFDTAYRAFLSRYKLYADDPGRNVALRVSATL